MEKALTLAGGDNLSLPLYYDTMLIAYACRDTQTDIAELDPGRSGSITLYRGDTLVSTNYESYMKLLLLNQICENGTDPVLDRIRSVINKNMKAAEGTRFSLENAYAMIGIDAVVVMDACWIGIAFEYMNVTAY
jgi:hypothetical protein